MTHVNPDAIRSPIENEYKTEQECCYVDMLHCFACLTLLTRRHVGDEDFIGEWQMLMVVMKASHAGRGRFRISGGSRFCINAKVKQPIKKGSKPKWLHGWNVASIAMAFREIEAAGERWGGSCKLAIASHSREAQAASFVCLPLGKGGGSFS